MTDENDQGPASAPEVEPAAELGKGVVVVQTASPSRASEEAPRQSFVTRLTTPWRRDRRQRTILQVCASVLALASIVGGSVALGWWWAASTIVAGSAVPDPEVVEVPVSSLADGAVMPDVRGLTPDTAQQVLADSGIPIALVQIVERTAAGPSGVVIEQNPVFGTTDPAAVTLVVSVVATMPTLVGGSADDAVSALLALGAAVEVVEVYRPEEPLGVVVASDPVAGEVVPSTVVVQVTAQPATVTLGELDHGSGCSTADPVTIGSADYPDSLKCTGTSSPRRVLWQFDGAVDRVVATLGLEAGADPGARVTVTLSGDGTVLGAWELAPGGSARVDVTTTGAQQFEIAVVATSQPGTDVLIGTPTAYGAPDPISALRQ